MNKKTLKARKAIAERNKLLVIQRRLSKKIKHVVGRIMKVKGVDEIEAMKLFIASLNSNNFVIVDTPDDSDLLDDLHVYDSSNVRVTPSTGVSTNSHVSRFDRSAWGGSDK